MHKITKMIHTDVVSEQNVPMVQPIHQTTLFKMPSYEEAIKHEHLINPSSYYTRMGNPTTQYLADQLCNITGYDKALIFPSGMAAIFTTIMALFQKGNKIAISNRLYGDATILFTIELTKLGVEVGHFDILNLVTLENLLKQGYNIIYFESLSNPDLVLADIDVLSLLSVQYNAISICDATFTPPGMIIDISNKIDICIHSLTKYISGNFAVSGGAVLTKTKKRLFEQIWEKQSLYGTCIDPHASWLISLSLPTLELRTKQQSINARKIAEFLKSHPKIKNVIYPKMDNYSQKKLSEKILIHGGGIIAFTLNNVSVTRIIENTKIITLAVSLGGCKSLIEHTGPMSHSKIKGNVQNNLLKVTTHELIRLSVGLENVEDLIEDLKNAFQND